MPIFLCSQCGCIENTALSRYWIRGKRYDIPTSELPPPLCSECDPQLGRWHGRFPKRVPEPGTYRPHGDHPHFIETVKAPS